MRQSIKDGVHVGCFIIGWVIAACDDDGTLSCGVWLLTKLLALALIAYGGSEGRVVHGVIKWLNKQFGRASKDE